MYYIHTLTHRHVHAQQTPQRAHRQRDDKGTNISECPHHHCHHHHCHHRPSPAQRDQDRSLAVQNKSCIPSFSLDNVLRVVTRKGVRTTLK